jgi:hypothetical protein
LLGKRIQGPAESGHQPGAPASAPHNGSRIRAPR